MFLAEFAQQVQQIKIRPAVVIAEEHVHPTATPPGDAT